MDKYEITIIYNPKFKSDTLKKFLNSVFDEKSYKLEELKKLEAAYKIKGFSKVKYYLVNVRADEASIKNFQRKANFEKAILRSLVINLDTEIGLNLKIQSHQATKMLAKFLHKKFSEKDLINAESQNQDEESTKDFQHSEEWEEELDNIKLPGAFGQELLKHLEDKSEFSAKNFFLNLGFKEEEIPKDIEKIIDKMEKSKSVALREKQTA